MPEIDEALSRRLCALLHLEPSRIKLDETFIRNGGDSLLAIRFSKLIEDSEHICVGVGPILRAKHLGDLLDKTELRKLATQTSSGPRVSGGDDLLGSSAISQQHNHAGIEDKTLDPIQRFPKVIPTTGLPITFIQAATAHYTHLVPGAAVQHVTQYCYTDVLPQLKEAFATAMSSHQAFRLKFEVTTSPLLVRALLKESFELNWTEHSSGSLAGTDIEDCFRRWSVEASQEPVFRVVTPSLDTSANDRKVSIVHWFCHLSLMDGRSMDILMRRIDGLMSGTPSPTGKVCDCTLDVVRSLSEYHARHHAAAREFWGSREDIIDSRNHPLLQTLDPNRTASSRVVRMRTIDIHYPEDVKAFQSRTGVTFEVLVRAAMALVLSKVQGGASTVALMSVHSRRSLPIQNIEEVVGSFATSMILAIDINEADTSNDLLNQVFHKVLELDEMSYSDPADGFSLGGLVVVSSDIHPHAPWYSGGKQTEVMSPKETLPTIYVGATGRVRFCYNSNWRTSSEMQVMTELFLSALINLASGTLSVGQCLESMLPISQRQQLLDWGNCFSTQTTLQGREDDITSLLQKQVGSRGDEAALAFRDQQLSHRKFWNMIRAVGRKIRKTLKPSSVVLLHADGSVNWIVAMFAVLWADCVFSPQGAALPHQLRSQHYAIAGAQAFLIPREDDMSTLLTPDGCEMRLCVETILRNAEREQEEIGNEPGPATTRQPKPLSSAYICFSSGTTGQPKAIRCTHAGVVSLLSRDLVARLHVSPGHRVAQNMAPAFDGALLEVFSALCFGGILVLKDPLEPFAHLRLVDSLFVTPSLAAELEPRDYHHLKYIYIGAEVLPQAIADRWSAGQAIVYNIYGPTECHMIATAQRVLPGQSVTIGRPFASARTYILDKRGRLAPPLVSGEMYIAGVQLSPGYIGLEEENKLRFVPDTIWPSDGGRMYRTGDWGYWTLDGQIAFVGRTDRQVKLGGFRIDLNDVQSRLQNAISAKARVAVVVVDGVLRCAVADAHDLTPEKVRAAAEDTLPPQHVPRVIRCLETMPVSPFGKVDYRAVAKLLK